MSSFWIVVSGLICMIVFEIFKLIIKKYAKSFDEKASKYYPWIIWIITFIVLFLISGIKYHNWIPVDSIINSGFITGMAVYGYNLLKPFIDKIIKK